MDLERSTDVNFNIWSIIGCIGLYMLLGAILSNLLFTFCVTLAYIIYKISS